MRMYLLRLVVLGLFISTGSVFAEEHKHIEDKIQVQTITTPVFITQKGDVIKKYKEEKKVEVVRDIYLINERINEKVRYSPATFVAKKGEKVRLHIHNTTDMPHGLSITEFQVAETVNPKENVIEFVADKEGLFDVFCQYHPGHFRAQLLVVK